LKDNVVCRAHVHNRQFYVSEAGRRCRSKDDQVSSFTTTTLVYKQDNRRKYNHR